MTTTVAALPALTRAQKRAAKRTRRNDPKAKARRWARRNARQAMAVERFERIDPFDAAFKMGD
jgi:hypothetical protein